MSRLIEELKRIEKEAPQAIGFRHGQGSTSRQRMLLVACLTGGDCSQSTRYADGADAGMVILSDGNIDSVRSCSAAVPGIPWGCRLKDVGGRKLGLTEAGCDFVVFPADTPLAVLADTGAGRILEIAGPLGDNLLRTLDRLPLDAVLVAGTDSYDSPITWQRLMLIQQVVDSVSKPVLAVASAQTTGSELGILWEAGVDGVVVLMGANRPPGTLSKLRKAMEKRTPSTRRRKRKTEALLPQISGEGEEESEDED